MKTPQIAPLAGMTPLGIRPTLIVTGSSWTEGESDHLVSKCVGGCGMDCPDRVKERPSTGRFYITMGHAGYNSPANNFDGYASKASALKASKGYMERGRRRAMEAR